MSAWLEQLSPDRRADMVQLWMELGMALLGDTNDQFRGVPQLVPAGHQQGVLPTDTRRSKPAAKKDYTRRRHYKRPGRMSAEMKARMFDLFDHGVKPKAAFEVLEREFGPLPVTLGAVSFWKTQWNRAKQAETGPVPT